jgi:hypothetical protein
MASTHFVLLSALSLSIAGSASANLICPGLSPVPFSTIETSIRTKKGRIDGKHIDCEKVAVGAKVVSGIQRMLGNELPTPRSITFRMVDQFDNAYFAPEDLSLNVPYQIVLDSYTKNPVYSPAVWAHEFGHAVLDATLASAASKWRSVIHRNLNGSADSDSASDILDLLIQPYHEFFADVIAVLYTGRPDAVAKALYLTGFMANPEGSPSECPNRSREECRPRNRTSDPTVMAYSRDFSDRRNQLGTWRGVDPRDDHDLLAPARYHVWKYYFSNPAIKSEKARLAGATVDAIMSDLNGRLKRLMSLPGGITPRNLSLEMGDVQRINREFIDTIDAVFRKTFPNAP